LSFEKAVQKTNFLVGVVGVLKSKKGQHKKRLKAK